MEASKPCVCHALLTHCLCCTWGVQGTFKVYPLPDDPSLPVPSHILTNLPPSAPEECIVRVYIVKAVDLQPNDPSGLVRTPVASNFSTCADSRLDTDRHVWHLLALQADPYVSIHLGKKKVDNRKEYVPNSLSPVFGKSVTTLQASTTVFHTSVSSCDPLSVLVTLSVSWCFSPQDVWDQGHHPTGQRPLHQHQGLWLAEYRWHNRRDSDRLGEQVAEPVPGNCRTASHLLQVTSIATMECLLFWELSWSMPCSSASCTFVCCVLTVLAQRSGGTAGDQRKS